jgi:pimeloyl-ACP methyl ester carboxylesterase
MKTLFAAVVFLAASAACCGLAAASPAVLPSLDIGPCHRRDLPEGSRCGVFKVAEDPARRPVRVLELKVIVLPATSKQPLEPVFSLPGGPGGSSTGDAPYIGDGFPRDEHPIVLVDPRGSDPVTGLECPTAGDDPQLDVTPIFTKDMGFWKRCRDALAKTHDLTRYTSPIEVEDLDALRRALGYDKIDLFGGSYGTRFGMSYIHAHGDHVRAALFTGLAPLANRTPLYHAAAAQRAFDHIARDCAEDPACHAAFPSMKQDLADVMARLRREPARVTINDRITGKPVEVTLTADGFAESLRVMMYSLQGGRRVPLLLQRAKAGDLTPFAKVGAAANGGLRRDLRLGLQLSVACPEDTSRIRPSEVAAATAGSFIGDLRVRSQMAACALWPKGRLPAAYFAPFKSNVPTVLVSGEVDPVTPPWLGEEAKKSLPNSLHLVTRDAHAEVNDCVAGIAAKVFRTGSVQGIDTSCVAAEKLPPFELK